MAPNALGPSSLMGSGRHFTRSSSASAATPAELGKKRKRVGTRIACNACRQRKARVSSYPVTNSNYPVTKSCQSKSHTPGLLAPVLSSTVPTTSVTLHTCTCTRVHTLTEQGQMQIEIVISPYPFMWSSMILYCPFAVRIQVTYIPATSQPTPPANLTLFQKPRQVFHSLTRTSCQISAMERSQAVDGA